ncbi:ATPase [Emticicia aquatilis]|uniref:ATPase n=1 Tax=Emticicia aquatilis TaxID=1537369 RepID=A0A916Z3E8_9BACT|nr:ATP-binding protein [Emticicia aquatilis]GGD75014.1 ATPase [Emticicia aquatilis]
MIQRIIADQVLFGLSFQPSIAILGPRQVGKTTFVKQLQQKLSKPSVYFDLERSSDLSKFQHDRLAFLETMQEQTVILDEIQRLPEIFPDIRSLIDQNRVPARFILLGSASFILLKNTSESLTGRISYFEMTPLLFRELQPDVDYIRHWLWGGFPNAYLAPTSEQQQKWFDDFVRSYLERDLPQLGLSASPIQLRRLMMMIASIQGSLLNQTMLANSLGIRNNLVSTYLDFFEQSFLIRRLQPYYTNIGKRLTKSPKIYIRDSGLVHHLLSIHSYENLLGHIVAGGSWEGYVIEQVISLLNYQQIPFFYRTADGAELDLVIEQDLQIKLAIEIKLSSSPTLSKGTTISLADLNNPPLLLITPTADDYLLKPNVWVCSIQTLSDNIRRILG